MDTCFLFIYVASLISLSLFLSHFERGKKSKCDYCIHYLYMFCLVMQGPVGQQKTFGSGNGNQHRHPSSRHQRSGSKRTPNSPAPFPLHVPLHQPPSMPHVIPTMVPQQHMLVPGYAYQPYPGPVPNVEPHLGKSGSETPVQNFVPPARGFNFGARRPNAQEPASQWNPYWHPQQGYSPRDNIPMQQGVGPRPFVRPPFVGPSQGPGFMAGPSFSGNYILSPGQSATI